MDCEDSSHDRDLYRLVHFGRALGRPDGSPFCVKAEAYLRLHGVSYETVRGLPMKGPRGQLPVMYHGGEVVAGSQEIVDYLRAQSDHVDGWLDPAQETSAYHLVKSVEEHLYFLLLYQRWLIPENFRVVQQVFFHDLHPLLRFLVSRFARRSARQRTIAQGLGRYSAAEIDRMTYLGLEMLSRSLGSKPFFMGDMPCWVDCSMFGFITNLMIPEFTKGAARWVRDFQNLVDYELRFAQAVFPDFLEGIKR